MSIISRIVGVGFVGRCAASVGTAGADVTNKFAEVVVVLDQFVAQLVKQLWVARRIADTNIVDGIDQTGSHEVSPHPVGNASREERVLSIDQPIGQHFPAIFALRFWCFTTQEFGRNVLVRHRMLGFTTEPVVNDLFTVVLCLLSANLAEESSEPVVIVHGPTIERMVVTLGTLSANAHKDLSNVFRRLQCVTFDLVKVCRWLAKRPARAGQKITLRAN